MDLGYIDDILSDKGIIKKYLVDNNINSMMDFMNPLLINNDIIINQGLNKFIKNQTLNNFLK